MQQDELNRSEHLRHLYREHIENCAVFAKEMLRGAFILNGAAVTAILASNNFKELKWAAFVFAVGTLLALVSGFIAYLYQADIAKTFKWYVTNKDHDKINPQYNYEQYWGLSFKVGTSSIIMFCLGLIICACRLG